MALPKHYADGQVLEAADMNGIIGEISTINRRVNDIELANTKTDQTISQLQNDIAQSQQDIDNIGVIINPITNGFKPYYTISGYSFYKNVVLTNAKPYYQVYDPTKHSYSFIGYQHYDIMFKPGNTYYFETITTNPQDANKRSFAFYLFNKRAQEHAAAGQNIAKKDLKDSGWQPLAGFIYEVPYYINGSEVVGARFVYNNNISDIVELRIYERKGHPIQKKTTLPNNATTFTALTFNVGGWGTTWSNNKKTDKKYGTCNYMDELITKYSPDIICTQEDCYDGQETAKPGLTDALETNIRAYCGQKEIAGWNIYAKASANQTTEDTGGTWNNTWVSKQNLTVPNQVLTKIEFNTVEGVDSPMGKDYTFIIVKLNDKNIGIFNTHLEVEYPNDDFGPDYEKVWPYQWITTNANQDLIDRYREWSYRYKQCKCILEDALKKQKEKTIDEYVIMGDFNTLKQHSNSMEQLVIMDELFGANNCTWANDFYQTYLGNYPSQYTNDANGNAFVGEEVDNIIVSSGLEIQEIYIDDAKIHQAKIEHPTTWVKYIDHLPLIAKIGLKN